MNVLIMIAQLINVYNVQSDIKYKMVSVGNKYV